MFKLVLILAIIGCAVAIPVRHDDDDEDSTKIPEVIAIIKSESDQQADGSYSFNYESADGNIREETAEVLNEGTDEQTIKITGSYQYIDADGNTVLVTYTADENGFVPVGTIIPKEISENAAAAKDLPKLDILKEEPARVAAKKLDIEEDIPVEEVESETESAE